MGESDDVVPVIANVPNKVRRDRSRNVNRDENGDREAVRKMVGEADSRAAVIPDDAEPVDAAEMTYGKPIRQPKEIVQEPSHPTADKEKYLTPYSALTAPDVTPMSTQPIDPNEVPGAATAEKFTAADLERAGEVGQSPPPTTDTAARVMDVLLGKGRAPKPPTQPGDFEQAGQISAEEAQRMVGVSGSIEEAASKAAAALVPAKDGGTGMPDPTPPSDGSRIYSAFRRFAG